jgi:hypothetical protein
MAAVILILPPRLGQRSEAISKTPLSGPRQGRTAQAKKAQPRGCNWRLHAMLLHGRLLPFANVP